MPTDDPPDRTAPRRSETRDYSVYTPLRRVTLADTIFDGIDMAVRVRHGLFPRNRQTFDVTLYNLATETFREYGPGTPIDIELGWDTGPGREVLAGVVESSFHTPDGSEDAYHFRGRSRAQSALDQRLSRSWNTTDAYAIARDIAALAGLSPGHLHRGTPTIDGYFAIDRSRPLRDWLDRLTKKVTRLSGTQWQWFTHAGALSFVPKEDRAHCDCATPEEKELATLSSDRALLAAEPTTADLGITNGKQPYELTMHCEPAIRKARRVDVATPETGLSTAVVMGYEFDSRSTAGTHHTRAIVAPKNADFDYDHARNLEVA